MAVDMKTLLPAFVSQLRGVAEILSACTLEAEALETATHEKYRQMAASTATSGLDVWERELALYTRPDLDDVSRRAPVLAALSFFSPCTPQTLTELYSKMTGGAASYTEHPHEYRIDLSTVTPGRVVGDLPGVYTAISKTAPAHVYCLLSAEGEMQTEQAQNHSLHASVVMDIYTAN